MIKIQRDNFPPDDGYRIGKHKGKQKWRVFENDVLKRYKNDDSQFTQGSFDFKQNPSSEVWKRELIKIQGQKCCYCEKPINTGDLEHYRPKNAWQQARGQALERPGYYWLAYRWNNILLSCKECNENKTKGNLFPIIGKRATTPTCSLKEEEALLVNPYVENPIDSLTFYKNEPIPRNPKGRLTIDLLDLKNRNDLAPIRKDRYNMYSSAQKIIKAVEDGLMEIEEKEVFELKENLRIAIKCKQPFSGMIQANFI